MIVPARIVERDADGRLWRTIIEPAAAAAVAGRRHRRAPGGYTITQVTGADAWDASVAAVLALIDAGTRSRRSCSHARS